MKPQQWKDRVAALGCILCSHLGDQETPAGRHHVREGQGKGQRAPDWLVVPLCHPRHQGPVGIHSAGFYARYRLDEMDLLAMTIAAAVR